MIGNDDLGRLVDEYGYGGLAEKRARMRKIDREVLKELLVENGMFGMIDGSPASVAQYNTAVALMTKLGFLDERNVELIVDFLYTLPEVGYVREDRNQVR